MKSRVCRNGNRTHTVSKSVLEGSRFCRKQVERVCQEQAGNPGKQAWNAGQEQAGSITGGRQENNTWTSENLQFICRCRLTEELQVRLMGGCGAGRAVTMARWRNTLSCYCPCNLLLDCDSLRNLWCVTSINAAIPNLSAIPTKSMLFFILIPVRDSG